MVRGANRPDGDQSGAGEVPALLPRILLIEDNAGDARLIRELLAEAGGDGFELEWAQRLGEGLERLDRRQPRFDAVLLDLSLPDSQGFETFVSVSSRAPRVPIIMLTGLDDEELAVRAVREGAQDYLAKGRVDGQTLARAVRYAIERRRIEESLIASEGRYRQLIESSPIAIAYARGAKVLYANPAYLRAFGFKSEKELRESPTAEQFAPEFRDLMAEQLSGWLAGEAVETSREIVCQRRDGSPFFAEITGARVEFADGPAALLFVIDIDERKRAQEARKVAEETAVESVRLYEDQRRIAITLQENFIHSLPRVPGLELAAVSQPACKPELVGGDFHDVFVLPGGNVAILVGDVEGKGVKAAGLTETVRSAHRAIALFGASPRNVLARLNKLLVHQESQLVTTLLVVIDPRTGVCFLGSAGHPPPIHLTKDSAEKIPLTPGLPLGAFEESKYPSQDFVLKPGEGVVLYTDGVTDARRGGLFFGEGGLIAAAETCLSGSAEEVGFCLRDAVVRFSSELRDDLQIIVVRRRPQVQSWD